LEAESTAETELSTLALDPVENPQRSLEDVPKDKFYKFPETHESYWDDIGFKEYILEVSAEQDDRILAHFARLQHPAVNKYQNLGRKIRAALWTSSWESVGRKFLPIDKLEHIITRKAIRDELERQGTDISLVDKIWEAGQSRTSSLTTRRKIFAILVLLDQVPAIIDFINEDLFDSDLPFVFRDRAGDREESFDVYRKVKQRDGEPDMEIELQFFQKWRAATLESFNRNQWQLLAPIFFLVSKDNMKAKHYILDSYVVLPFIEDNMVDEPPAQHGGSAEVRHVKIHRAHQNLYISVC
jgi:hypothetical protein